MSGPHSALLTRCHSYTRNFSSTKGGKGRKRDEKEVARQSVWKRKGGTCKGNRNGRGSRAGQGRGEMGIRRKEEGKVGRQEGKTRLYKNTQKIGLFGTALLTETCHLK